jgi:Flp pilus assembly pilin Flp
MVHSFERRHTVAKASDHPRRSLGGEEGATMVEYALLLGLIGIICIAGLMQIGNINALFFSIGSTL